MSKSHIFNSSVETLSPVHQSPASQSGFCSHRGTEGVVVVTLSRLHCDSHGLSSPFLQSLRPSCLLSPPCFLLRNLAPLTHLSRWLRQSLPMRPASTQEHCLLFSKPTLWPLPAVTDMFILKPALPLTATQSPFHCFSASSRFQSLITPLKPFLLSSPVSS